MAILVNDIDILLQAAGTRLISMPLPAGTTIDFDDVIGANRPDNGADVTGANTALNILNQGSLAVEDLVTTLLLANDAVNAAKLSVAAINGTSGNLNANTVTAAQIVAGSVTAVEMTVGTLSAITANLGTINSGTLNAVNIYGSGDISVTGRGRFDGNYTSGGYNSCLELNSSHSANSGLVAFSNSYQGVLGIATGGAKGVQGVTHGTGAGVSAYDVYGSGVALDVVGKMVINNSTLVTNLNADKLDGLHATGFHRKTDSQIRVAASGSYNEGGEVVLDGYGSAYDITIDNFGAGTSATKMRVHWNGSTKMELDNSGNMTISGANYNTSDRRVKRDIRRIKSALSKVLAISGYTFERTDVEAARQTGVIAQEVEKVLPEAVLTSENGSKTVAYGNMIGLLIEAVKELSGQIEKIGA